MEYAERVMHEYAVVCVHCGDLGPWALSQAEAVHVAREAGWSVGLWAMCPSCLRERPQSDAGLPSPGASVHQGH